MLDVLRSVEYVFGLVAFIWRGLRTLCGYPPTKCGETFSTGGNIAAAVFVAAIILAGMIGLLLR
jgi:hypothetical protein